jgi:hypothetical protein
VESVTKHSFAGFRGIFAKLSSKILVDVVLTEKGGWEELDFGLDRSDAHFSVKIFVLGRLLCHAVRGSRYLVVLSNKMWCKSEIW